MRMCRELIKVPPQKGLLSSFRTNATCHGREYGEVGAPPTICPVAESIDEGLTPQSKKLNDFKIGVTHVFDFSKMKKHIMLKI